MGAGKTSLVLRFVKGQFSEYQVIDLLLMFSCQSINVSPLFLQIIVQSTIMLQESTIGAAFFTQVLSLNEASIKFDIWDTAGQERYHSLAPMYYRGAAAAIVVYDITSMVGNYLSIFFLCSARLEIF